VTLNPRILPVDCIFNVGDFVGIADIVGLAVTPLGNVGEIVGGSDGANVVGEGVGKSVKGTGVGEDDGVIVVGFFVGVDVAIGSSVGGLDIGSSVVGSSTGASVGCVVTACTGGNVGSRVGEDVSGSVIGGYVRDVDGIDDVVGLGVDGAPGGFSCAGLIGITGLVVAILRNSPSVGASVSAAIGGAVNTSMVGEGVTNPPVVGGLVWAVGTGENDGNMVIVGMAVTDWTLRTPSCWNAVSSVIVSSSSITVVDVCRSPNKRR
jgi:hypothetical protein